MSFLDAIFGNYQQVHAPRITSDAGKAAITKQGNIAAARARGAQYGMATMRGGNAANIRQAQMGAAQSERDIAQQGQVQAKQLEQSIAQQNASNSMAAQQFNAQTQNAGDAAQLGMISSIGAGIATGGASLAAQGAADQMGGGGQPGYTSGTAPYTDSGNPGYSTAPAPPAYGNGYGYGYGVNNAPETPPGQRPYSDSRSKAHIQLLSDALAAERARSVTLPAQRVTGQAGPTDPRAYRAQGGSPAIADAAAASDQADRNQQRDEYEGQRADEQGYANSLAERQAYERWAASQPSPAAPQTSDAQSKQAIQQLAERNARLSQALVAAGQRSTAGLSGPPATSGENAPGAAQTAPATDALMPLRPVSYEYRPGIAGQPGAPPGRHTGVLAQDLERTPAGAATVQPGPDGMKRVDPGRLSLLLAAADAEQERRLRALEAERAQMPGPARTGGL